MKRLDIYKAAVTAGIETLDINDAPKLDVALAQKADTLALNEADYTLFYGEAVNIRNRAQAHKRADEQNDKLANMRAQLAKPVKISKAIIPLLAFLFALCLPVSAAVTATNSVTYGAVNATNANGNSINLGGVALPARSHVIQHAGLANTNALQVIDQVSIDGSNWTSLSTNLMSSTNATTYSWKPTTTTVTIYRRVQVVTTNNVTVGVTTIREQ